MHLLQYVYSSGVCRQLLKEAVATTQEQLIWVQMAVAVDVPSVLSIILACGTCRGYQQGQMLLIALLKDHILDPLSSNMWCIRCPGFAWSFQLEAGFVEKSSGWSLSLNLDLQSMVWMILLLVGWHCKMLGYIRLNFRNCVVIFANIELCINVIILLLVVCANNIFRFINLSRSDNHSN